jgi:hypothetical protein
MAASSTYVISTYVVSYVGITLPKAFIDATHLAIKIYPNRTAPLT